MNMRTASALPCPKFWMPLVSLPLNAYTLQGSLVGTLKELQELVELVKEGKFKPSIPVSIRKLDEAFQSMMDLKEGKLIGRAVLVP